MSKWEDGLKTNMLGQKCSTKCIIKICEGAEADIATNGGSVNHASNKENNSTGTIVPSGERPVENSPQEGVETSIFEQVETTCFSQHVHAKMMNYANILMQAPLIDQDESGEWVEIPRYTAAGLPKYKPQSGITNDVDIMRVASNAVHENVQFADQNEVYAYDVKSTVDPTRTLQDSSDATLDNFFSRPIKIFEEEWGTGTSLAFDLQPWELYFENPRVINRIANYNLLRANLNVKIVINGNGFQYGRALVSYLPLEDFDDLSSNAALIKQDLVQASQQPHIFLDPTTSSGGTMKLPFFYHKNYLSIPDGDWADMGRLFIRSLNDLKHANGASDQVTVSIFAWASDVSLSVLTSVDPVAMTPQSGEESEIDEANSKGMISGPASVVAKISNAMAVIPPIQPYALATEKVAKTVGKLAKSLGYCRPPVTANPDPYRPTPISHLAATNTPDTALKLSVDDKQELTIDPRIAGLGAEDPLSIREIAKRESYLTTFPWTLGTTPETLLWNSRISPVTWAESGLSPKAFHFPACAMAALPFKYWTGTMNFRFQIVCSSFHKGRIKVVYDPGHLESNEYNTNYLEVIDISDKQDFTISIGNGQPETLLRHADPGQDSVTTIYSNTTYTTNGLGNGTLGVYVVNELTTPNSTVNNDIEVNVFVSMGDDFEVFVPDDYFQAFVFKPQSGVEGSIVVPESQNTEEPSAPQQSDATNVGPGMQDNALINMVYTGESIMSFRQLLKRYNLWRRDTVDTTERQTNYLLVTKMFPFLRGNVLGAVDVTGAGAGYNYCNTVLLHWIVGAFQGWRGGIRYKMLVNSLMSQKTTGQLNASSSAYVTREANDFPYTYFQLSTAQNTYTRSEEAAVQVIPDFTGTAGVANATGTKGMAYANLDVNPCLEWEAPFYSRQRFMPGKEENWASNSRQVERMRIAARLQSSALTFIDYHVASAEDFQVYFFTGLPRMYYEGKPPVASV